MSSHSTSAIRRSSALPSVWLAALEPVLRVRVAVDYGDGSTGKLLRKGCEDPNQMGARRHTPPGGSVSHESSKLLRGLAIDPALAATYPQQPGFPEARAVQCG